MPCGFSLDIPLLLKINPTLIKLRKADASVYGFGGKLTILLSERVQDTVGAGNHGAHWAACQMGPNRH